MATKGELITDIAIGNSSGDAGPQQVRLRTPLKRTGSVHHQPCATHSGDERLKPRIQIHRPEDKFRQLKAFARRLKVGPAAATDGKPEWCALAATARQFVQPVHC